MHNSSLIFFLAINLILNTVVFHYAESNRQQNQFIPSVFAAKVNSPFVTKFPDDVSGKDVFKVNLEITGLNKTVGLLETCLSVVSSTMKHHLHASELCHISNMTREYLYYFPSTNCPSCIIPIGTAVFPHNYVFESDKITACSTEIKTRTSKCNYTFNHDNPITENIIISMR